MNTRFLMLLLAAATMLVGPATGEAWAERVARLGFIHSDLPKNESPALSAFWQRLHELGWSKGQNLIVVLRSANGQTSMLRELIDQVIQSGVDVLVPMTTPAVLAAKEATSTIPIVMIGVGDPVGAGIVPSLARPGGNITGVSLGFTEEFSGKYLELLQEVLPRLSTVAVIYDPDNPSNRALAEHLKVVAPTRRLEIRLIEMNSPDELDPAFNKAHRQAQVAVVLTSAFAITYRQEITALARRYRVPAIYPLGEYVDAGGLMAYGPDQAEMFSRAAEYVDKILKGAAPAELPVAQPTRFSLSLNLKAARALGLKIPESILLRANNVIR